MNINECKNCGEKKEVVNLDDATLSVIREKQPICTQCVSKEMETEFPCISCLDNFIKSKMNTIGRSVAEDTYGRSRVNDFLNKIHQIYTEIDENVGDNENLMTCDDCHNEFMMCDICEELVHSDDAEQKFDGRDNYVFHDVCLSDSDQFADCYSCGDFLNSQGRRNVIMRSQEDNTAYCQDCYYERYTSCESCNEEISRDDMLWCDETETEMCESCYPESCSPDDIDSIRKSFEESRSSPLPSVSTHVISKFEKLISACLISSELPIFSNPKTDDLKSKINAELQRMISINNKKAEMN